MLILFDHGTPAPLQSFLTGHTVREAKAEGWDKLVFGYQVRDGLYLGFDSGTYAAIATHSEFFAGVTGTDIDLAMLQTGDEVEQIRGSMVMAKYFDVLGITPIMGRGFLPSDHAAAAPPVVIISHDLMPFAPKTREPVSVAREQLRQDLQRDVATEPGVFRTIHLAHAAGADGGDDVVGSKSGAEREGQMGGVSIRVADPARRAQASILKDGIMAA